MCLDVQVPQTICDGEQPNRGNTFWTWVGIWPKPLTNSKCWPGEVKLLHFNLRKRSHDEPFYLWHVKTCVFHVISRYARSFGVPIPKHVAAINYYQLISTADTKVKALTDEVNHINRSYSTVFPGSWYSCTCALTHETCQNQWININKK